MEGYGQRFTTYHRQIYQVLRKKEPGLGGTEHNSRADMSRAASLCSHNLPLPPEPARLSYLRTWAMLLKLCQSTNNSRSDLVADSPMAPVAGALLRVEDTGNYLRRPDSVSGARNVRCCTSPGERRVPTALRETGMGKSRRVHETTKDRSVSCPRPWRARQAALHAGTYPRPQFSGKGNFGIFTRGPLISWTKTYCRK